MKTDQKNAFLNYEADEWFSRNKKTVQNYDSTKDEVINLISQYNLKADSILELGSSAGYRLHALNEIYPSSDITGLEPSKLAIEFGLKNYPRVNFIHGTADDLTCFKDNSIDLIIVGFIFYVIDRNLLLKVISEIDRVLKNGGVIIVIDFFSEIPVKNVYEHISEIQAFSYKQNYEEIFTASKLYYLIDKSSYSHIDRLKDSSSDYFNKYSISLLKKDLEASYR